MLKDGRPTRFHTESNVLVGFREVLSWLLRSPVYVVEKLGKERKRIRPWWPLNCIDYVDKWLKPHHKVMEFGAGSSTLWLARRVNHITSIEDNIDWIDKVNAKVNNLKINNISVLFREKSNYYQVDDLNVEGVDFFVVDGAYRWLCLESIVQKMKVGALIYLDNSDSDKDRRFYNSSLDEKLARKFIFSFSGDLRYSIFELHGMIDGEFYAGSGLFMEKVA